VRLDKKRELKIHLLGRSKKKKGGREGGRDGRTAGGLNFEGLEEGGVTEGQLDHLTSQGGREGGRGGREGGTYRRGA